MKRILVFLAVIALCGCRDTKIGYLITDNAEYIPKTMEIPKEIDRTDPKNKTRVDNNAPWVTYPMQGVLGTQPINYAIADVEATDGGNAQKFREELVMRGGGMMEVPLDPASPVGTYVVSVRVYNEDHSQILTGAFTFTIK